MVEFICGEKSSVGTGDAIISFSNIEMLTFHRIWHIVFAGCEQCKHPEVENDSLSEQITVGQR